MVVLPEDAGPVSSVIAPTGIPPLSSSSIWVMPVGRYFANGFWSRGEDRGVAVLESTLDLLTE